MKQLENLKHQKEMHYHPNNEINIVDESPNFHGQSLFQDDSAPRMDISNSQENLTQMSQINENI